MQTLPAMKFRMVFTFAPVQNARTSWVRAMETSLSPMFGALNGKYLNNFAIITHVFLMEMENKKTVSPTNIQCGDN
jgi:hypothetical protein